GGLRHFGNFRHPDDLPHLVNVDAVGLARELKDHQLMGSRPYRGLLVLHGPHPSCASIARGIPPSRERSAAHFVARSVAHSAARSPRSRAGPPGPAPAALDPEPV